jgi:uncharacterized protein YbaR (Trm112 family)
MSGETLEAKYGKSVDVDICHPCSALWFDSLEDLALAPSGVLRLFVVINDNRAAQRQPLPTTMACPRCRQPLVLTHDMQRTTRFTYWRCPSEHGHFMTFFEFLREKNFVRPLSGPEIAALQGSVRTITCSSCGAPVNIETGAVCPYCRAPLSMLDPKQMETVVNEFKREAATRQTVDPTLAVRLLQDKAAVDKSFAGNRGPSDFELSDASGLVDAGLAAVVALLKSRS